MEKCRICGTMLGDSFFTLGTFPLSNNYLTCQELKKMEPHYPLELYLCATCHLVQLDVFERAEKIFSHDYAYFSSFSESWLSHCEKYVDMIVKRQGLDGNSFVVEVASNDGYLLQYFKKYGITSVGIEPAYQTAFAALKRGVNTEPLYFTAELAKSMARKGPRPDLIIGNNVLAHNPDVRDFVEGHKILLDDHGIITMEFPHILNMIEKNEFDTIYHEHFSYLSFHSTNELFLSFGLSIFDVEELPTHGGSLRIYAAHTENSTYAVSERVRQLLEKEEQHGLFNEETYSEFANRALNVKYDFLEFLLSKKREGKRIAAYGAPAKGNTLLNYCGIKDDLIEFTVDRSHVKQGKFLPGSHIPIYSPDYIEEQKPDYLVILPWNLRAEIEQQMDGIRQWGGRFVVAIPELAIW